MRIDVLRLRARRLRTRFIGLALALTVVVTTAGVAAAVADALAFDDASPCPAAYTEPVGEEPGPQPPFVCPGGLVGTPYAVQLVGRGGCEPYFRFTAVTGALPTGLSISSRGLISGTPSTAGRWTFRVRAEDLRAAEGGPEWCTSSGEAEGEFVIAVDPGIVITTESAAPGTIGAFYSLALSAQMVSGPSQLSPPPGCAAGASPFDFCPLTWSIAQGQLPPGFTLNPVSGLIWGTPTAEGSASFVVRAALDDGRAATKSLTIAIRRPLSIQVPKPFAVPGAPTHWEVGVPFAAKLAASGGTARRSWSLTGGLLPRGLALAADGTMVGTPRAAGRFRATIHVADEEGRTADYPVDFRVASRLAISTHKLLHGRVGLPYRAKLATKGGLVPKRWSVESGLLPRGIRLDRVRGTLSGTPTRSGSYRITFQARDTLGVTAARTLVIGVLA
jgi:hypothetical protein